MALSRRDRHLPDPAATAAPGRIPSGALHCRCGLRRARLPGDLLIGLGGCAVFRARTRAAASTQDLLSASTRRRRYFRGGGSALLVGSGRHAAGRPAGHAVAEGGAPLRHGRGERRRGGEPTAGVLDAQRRATTPGVAQQCFIALQHTTLPGERLLLLETRAAVLEEFAHRDRRPSPTGCTTPTPSAPRLPAARPPFATHRHPQARPPTMTPNHDRLPTRSSSHV